MSVEAGWIANATGPGPHGERGNAADAAAPLDAYSAVVTSVVRELTPSVASLAVRRRGGRRSADTDGGGSGVAFTPDGFILTSAHVVASAEGVSASFADGREFGAEIVGADPLSDLAVVRVRSSDLVPARLGDASRLQVGQLVVAIGSPLGFHGSATAGVVSGLGRSLPTRTGSATRLIENVIQTDAALHPGNSGGALANGAAEVIGINTAVVGPGFGQGLGLAVPINEATQPFIASLMTNGKVRRAYLGIVGGPRPLPPRAAAAARRTAGIEVLEVVSESPAARAGLRSGDLIVALEGSDVADMSDLQRVVDQDAIGRSLSLRVFRGRDLQTLRIVPAELAG